MAFIHKETFDIIQYNEVEEHSDDYFEVDDLIALPIQVLNRKGYTTRWSCSGHPFDNYTEFYSTTDFADTKCPFPNIVSIDEVDTPESPDYKYRFVQRLPAEWSSYVVFEVGVTLPSSPKGFSLDDHTGESVRGTMPIVVDDDGNETEQPLAGTITITTTDRQNPDMLVYERIQEIVDAMRVLYDWAVALPER